MRTLAGLAAAAALVMTVACGQTDAGITTAVKSKLAADEVVKAYQVDVDTSNKVVTLRGAVQTEAQKEHAVMIARNTEGVADVIDQLQVSPTAATSGRIDADGDVDIRGDVDVDVSDELERGGREVKEGAREVGDAIDDAVTDDDRK